MEGKQSRAVVVTNLLKKLNILCYLFCEIHHYSKVRKKQNIFYHDTWLNILSFSFLNNSLHYTIANKNYLYVDNFWPLHHVCYRSIPATKFLLIPLCDTDFRLSLYSVMFGQYTWFKTWTFKCLKFKCSGLNHTYLNQNIANRHEALLVKWLGGEDRKYQVWGSIPVSSAHTCT